MSSDTVSLLFPDRPIRPLPRRRLRERLTPELAGSIKYPPSTHDIIPLFYYPMFSPKNDGRASSIGTVTGTSTRGLGEPAERNSTSRRAGLGLLSGTQSQARSPMLTGTQPGRQPAHLLTRLDQLQTASAQPRSTSSSIDGYDSFENTNNKKKRKIPTAGDSVSNNSHAFNNETMLLNIPKVTNPPSREVNDERPQLNLPTLSGIPSYTLSNQGLSGSGRGRLGRFRNGRSPLRALPDGNSTWPGQSTANPSPWSPIGSGSSIISNAIAKAEKLSQQSQEDVSLFEQRSYAEKTVLASSQFTFTCESQVPGVAPWPSHSSRRSAMGQTGPKISSANSHLSPMHNASLQAGNGPAGNSRKKSRRRSDRDLLLAARHRRQVAADSYYHSPPKLEDIWICEFCEYERIFGEPPRTLIRDYEIKDRRQRQEETDRKRLLAKAKAKSRKGRKACKPSSKGNHVALQSPDQVHDPLDNNEGPSIESSHNQSLTQSDDEYDDEINTNYINTVVEQPPSDNNTYPDPIISSRAKT